MSFGWSAGDIVLAIKLLVKIGSALREADGAKAEFQEAAGSLAGLETALQYLEQQQQAADTQRRADLQGNPTSAAQHSAREAMLRTSIDFIKDPVSSFLDDIEKYDKSLSTRSKLHFTSGARRKIQWALFVSDKVKELQSRIAIPMHTLNTLQHQTTLESISDLRHTLPSDIGHILSTKVPSNSAIEVPPVNIPYCLLPYTPNPDFVGRSVIMDQLKAALAMDVGNQQSQPQARAALWGLGGTGKSQIAIKYAYWLRESDPDISVFWIYGGTSDRFRQAYENIAQHRSVAKNRGLDRDLLDSVKNWLAAESNGHWLMIVDNADDGEVFFDSAGSGSTLSKYIPDCSHGALLVTTRDKNVGINFTKGRGLIEIPGMDKDESKELITKGIRGNIDNGTAVDKLTKLLEYIPLALAQAAAFMQQNTLTITEYLEIYDERPDGLIDLLSVPFEGQGRDHEVPNPVAATWMISFNQIRRTNTRAADMMCLMACLNRQAIPEVLIRKSDESLLDFRKARGLLIAFSLVHVDCNVVYCSMHRLVHLVLRKCLAVEGELAKWISNALDIVYKRFHDHVDNSWEAYAAYQPQLEAALQLPSEEKDRLTKAYLLCATSLYHARRQDFTMSASILLQSIAIQTSISGAGHENSLRMVNTLVEVYLLDGQLNKAEILCSAALAAAIIATGSDHVLILKTTTQLAKIYLAQGSLNESVSLLLQIIQTAEQQWGEHCGNEPLIDSYDELNRVYIAQGRPDDAEKLCLRMLRRCERLLGKDHPSTLLFTANLTWTYMILERWSDAEGSAQRVLNAERSRLGSKNSKTFRAATNLARIYRNVGKLHEGLQLEDELLKLGTGDDPRTFAAMKTIGWNSFKSKEYFRAETVWLQLHSVQTKAFGEDHFSPLEALENISLAYYKQGRCDDAFKLALDAYDEKRRTLPQTHVSLCHSLKCLAILHDAHRRYDDASKYASELFEMRRRMLGQDHSYVHICMELLTGIQFRQRHYEKAEELTSLLWQARKTMLGPSHQDTLRVMGSLAIISSDQVRLQKNDESFIDSTMSLQRKLCDGHIDGFWGGCDLPSAYPRQHYNLALEQLLAEAVGFIPLPEDDEAVDDLRARSSS